MAELRRLIAVGVVGMLLGGSPSMVEAASKAAKTSNGAIAFHRASNSYGYSVNKVTAREAQVEALKQCGNERCEVVVRLRNNCGAVANGAQRFSSATGATRQEAETRALRTCGSACETVAWACTR
jgi:hypothetical protein